MRAETLPEINAPSAARHTGYVEILTPTLATTAVSSG
jgi:hypothetical protein